MSQIRKIAPVFAGLLFLVLGFSAIAQDKQRDGVLDIGFNDGGSFLPNIDYAIGPDGKIVGYENPWAYDHEEGTHIRFHRITRLSRNGVLDPSMGPNGQLWLKSKVLPFEGKTVAIQQDNKILIAGSTERIIPFNRATTIRFTDFAVARLNPDGTKDTSFGINGLAVIDSSRLLTTFADEAHNIFLQADGKIVLIGRSVATDDVRERPNHGAKFGEGYFSAVRLNSDGSLDDSFGEAGVTMIRFGYSAYKTTFVIGPGIIHDKTVRVSASRNPHGGFVMGARSLKLGKPFKGGLVVKFVPANIVVAQVSEEGTPNSFSGRDKVELVADELRDIVVQTDGRILVSSLKRGLTRINPDGSLDPTLVGFRLPNDSINDKLYPFSDGRVLVAGIDRGRRHVFFQRYDAAFQLDQSFGVNGTAAAGRNNLVLGITRIIQDPSGNFLIADQRGINRFLFATAN